MHMSRRHPRIRCAVLAAVAGLAACADQTGTGTSTESEDELPPVESREVASPTLSSVQASPPDIQMCGATVEMGLTNGTDTPGNVVIGNDATNLYLTYVATKEHWYISDTRIAAVATVA